MSRDAYKAKVAQLSSEWDAMDDATRELELAAAAAEDSAPQVRLGRMKL